MAHKILVVDDEQHIIQILAMKLGEAGYDVLTASDGREALEVVRRTPPDLVITDLHMGGMDGDELCRVLRSAAATRHLPLVVLTARGYALGTYDLPSDIVIVSKPFSPRSMIRVVEQCLAERRRATPPESGMEAA